MREGVTRLAMGQLQEKWAGLVQAQYEGLRTAEDLIAFLSDSRYRNSLGYALARYLQERFGRYEAGRCTITAGGAAASVTPYRELSGALLPSEETEDYARLVAALAKANGLGDKFPLKLCRAYVTGKKDSLSRETCFQLSFALGMEQDDVYGFLEGLGHAPYSLRSPEECVYYFCQNTLSMNSWSAAQEILSEYRRRREEAGPESLTLAPGQTQMIEWRLTELAEELDSLSAGEEAGRKGLVDFLTRISPLLTGHSLSAYALFDRKLAAVKALAGVEEDQELAVAMWSPIWVQFSRKSRKGGQGAETPGAASHYDFVPFRDLLDLPKTLYEKPLWRARIRKLRAREIPVEKRDILFLSLMEWIWSGWNYGGAECMEKFLLEVNNDLVSGGLSMIYPPNLYDRMILLAVCSPEPLDVLADIFEVSTSETDLEDRLQGDD